MECPPKADGKTIAQLAAEGQPQALQVFQQAGQALGVGIATMAHLAASGATHSAQAFNKEFAHVYRSAAEGVRSFARLRPLNSVASRGCGSSGGAMSGIMTR